MNEIQTEKGLLRLTRNLGVIATSSFVLMSAGIVSAGIASGTLTSQEPAVRYFAGALMIGNALISGKMTYDTNKQLKKLK